MKSLVYLLFIAGYATATTSTYDEKLHELMTESSQMRSVISKSVDEEFPRIAQTDIKDYVNEKIKTALENLLDKIVNSFQKIITQIDDIKRLKQHFGLLEFVYDDKVIDFLKKIKEGAKKILDEVKFINFLGGIHPVNVSTAGITFGNLKGTMDFTGEQMASRVTKNHFYELLEKHLDKIRNMKNYSQNAIKDLVTRMRAFEIELSNKIIFLLDRFEILAEIYFKKAGDLYQF